MKAALRLENRYVFAGHDNLVVVPLTRTNELQSSDAIDVLQLCEQRAKITRSATRHRANSNLVQRASKTRGGGFGIERPRVFRVISGKLTAEQGVGLCAADMILNQQQLTVRDKLILAGLYLSKFDAAGLEKLGFESFVEAFNVFGYALCGRPARIKNYRDEFDPLFPNSRKGWHKRPRRAYCLKLLDEYGGLTLDEFSSLIQSFVGLHAKLLSQFEMQANRKVSMSSFASRFATGVAAERYFQAMHPRLPEFQQYALEDTTQLGCGYDFRLRREGESDFLAVEVKGLKDRTGSLSLTSKERDVAVALADKFYLFVVKNFRESPYHEIYRAPLAGPLHFKRNEQVIVQVTWVTAV